MALTKTLSLSNGLIAPDAYIRVDSISGCKGTLTVSVNSYLSEAAFKGLPPFVREAVPGVDLIPEPEPKPDGEEEFEMVDASPDEQMDGLHDRPRYEHEMGPVLLPAPVGYLEQELIEFTPDVSANAPHFIAQAYDHLLTLPKYAGAQPA